MKSTDKKGEDEMITKAYDAGFYRNNLKFKMLTECPKCGQLFSGTIYCKSGEWEEISKIARTKIASCHICKSRILQKEIHSVWSADGTPASLKKQLREKISQFEAEEYRTAIGKQISKIKSVPDMKVDNEIVSKVKSDIPSLKSYIQQLIDLEIWMRFIEEQIVNLDEEKTTIKKVKTYVNALDAKTVKKKIETKEKSLLEEIDKLKKKFNSTDWVGEVEPIKLVAPSNPRYLKEVSPEKPVAPIMKQPNFFNKKKVLAENKRLQQEYEKECQMYEHELKQLGEAKSKNAMLRQAYEDELKKYYENVEIEKERVEEEKKRLKEEGAIKKKEAKKELDKKIDEINKKIEDLKNSRESDTEDTYAEITLKKEKDECFNVLKTLCETRNKLFSVNIIYPNYRDIFALSSFYEYFNSERCYELEGPDGAYNLYESERRGDSFSTFFRTLEDISKNQVVLYRETSNMFKNLKGLVNSLKEATKTIADKKDDKISEKFVEESFEKYFAKNEKFKQEITKSVENALEYLKQFT